MPTTSIPVTSRSPRDAVAECGEPALREERQSEQRRDGEHDQGRGHRGEPLGDAHRRNPTDGLRRLYRTAVRPGESLAAFVVRVGIRIAVLAVLVQTVAHLGNEFLLDDRVEGLDADIEGNSFTWASSVATFTVAWAAALHAAAFERQRREFSVLAGLALWFSLDDVAIIHERVALELGEDLLGMPDYLAVRLWLILYLPLLLLAGLVLWRIAKEAQPPADRAVRPRPRPARRLDPGRARRRSHAEARRGRNRRARDVPHRDRRGARARRLDPARDRLDRDPLLRSDAHCVPMKTVILAGGYGTRISEESAVRPKPMVEIGEKPILWHIMKIYAAHGIDEFVIAAGYRGYLIKEYFANYFLHTTDITVDLARRARSRRSRRARSRGR